MFSIIVTLVPLLCSQCEFPSLCNFLAFAMLSPALTWTAALPSLYPPFSRTGSLDALPLRMVASLCFLSTVFRCYLLSGKQFNLVTDNMPNTFLQTLSRRQARWSEYLQRFNFNWVHRAGRHNVADPLSRNPNFQHLNALLAVSTRGSTGKRSVQELHTAPNTTASRAGQKRRKGVSSPATGANTIPLTTADKQQPTLSQPQSSSS